MYVCVCVSVSECVCVCVCVSECVISCSHGGLHIGAWISFTCVCVFTCIQTFKCDDFEYTQHTM